MRIVFLTNTLTRTAVPYLEALVVSHHEIVGVFLVDRSAKFKRRIFEAFSRYGVALILSRIWQTFLLYLRYVVFRSCPWLRKSKEYFSVREFALDRPLPLFFCENINDRAVLDKLKSLKPDVIFVCTLNQFLGKQIREACRYGCINIHAGFLPRYRGPASNFWVLFNREEKTGVTFHYMTERMDAGDIILQKELSIFPDDTEETLDQRIAVLGATSIGEVIQQIETNTVRPRKQSEQEATYFSQPNFKYKIRLAEIRRTAVGRQNRGVSKEYGQPSAGFWQNQIRKESSEMCRDAKGKLLEIGCGEGLFLALLAKKNKDLELYGVDKEKRAIASAEKFLKEKSCGRITLCETQAARLPYEDSFFDNVACVNILYNLPTPQEVEEMLQEAERVLKSGGSIFFDFKNSRNPLVRFKYRWAKYYDATIAEQHLPLTTLDPVFVSSMLLRLGFLTVREKNFGFPWDLWAPIVIIQAQKK